MNTLVHKCTIDLRSFEGASAADRSSTARQDDSRDCSGDILRRPSRDIPRDHPWVRWRDRPHV